MATYLGKDVSKLKAKGGGKWKYLSEKDMLDVSTKFAPYRSLSPAFSLQPWVFPSHPTLLLVMSRPSHIRPRRVKVLTMS